MNQLSFLDQLELNFKATELRLGLPGTGDPETSSCFPINNRNTFDLNNSIINNKKKRASLESAEDDCGSSMTSDPIDAASPKTQMVGWPPIRSYRKKNNNNTNTQPKQNSRDHHVEGGIGGGVLVKVSVDGAPYLRKIDLRVYRSYAELLMALEAMFGVRIGLDYAPTYEDRDGDWMLAGDVPWEMFVSSCKRLRIMRSLEVKGLGYHL